MDMKPLNKMYLISLVIMVLIISALACSLPGMSSPTVITVVVTQIVNEPQKAATVPLAEAPTITTEPATQTAEPPTVTATIAHVTHPDAPTASNAFMWDSDSSTTAAQRRPKGGENFDVNLFERPFNAQTQDIYFPEVDINQSALNNSSPWIYATITLKSPSTTSGKLDATYGIELDLNMDGRGDYLIVANAPNATAWSTDGVMVYQDENQNVGNNVPIKSDPPQQGDGYEKLVFDQGKGTDPDLAWARVAADKPNVVWIAFKSSLAAGSQKYLWGAWAQRGGMHPEWLDYNDHFTHDEAGDPLPGVAQYPLKKLAEVDNTCRWAVGFAPDGSEPGICPVPATPTPIPPSETPITPTPTLRKLIITRYFFPPTHTPTPIIIK